METQDGIPMKKILIPTDFSRNSKSAIRYLLDLFKETPCHFFLLYVNMKGSDFTEKPIYGFGTNILVEKEPKAIGHKLKDLEKFVTSISSKKGNVILRRFAKTATFSNLSEDISKKRK